MNTRANSANAFRQTWNFLCGLFGLIVLTFPSFAGELKLAWKASEDSSVAGYRVYLGTEPGVYTKVVDAPGRAEAVVQGLEDGRPYVFAVRAYDAQGSEIGPLSLEIVSLPKPRIESIEPACLDQGSTAYVTLRGANFDRDARVRSGDSRLVVRSVVHGDAGELIVLVEALPAAKGETGVPVVLAPSAFTVINLGRKAEEYFRAHPEALDVNGDHKLDARDLGTIQAAFGSRPGEELYQASADLDDDGVVDGGDLSRLVARMSASSHDSSPLD